MSWLTRKKKPVLVGSNRLTNHEHQELERVLLNCQIEAVSDALVPYLSRMKSLLREYEHGKVMFENRFNAICDYLEGLKQNPKYALNEFKQKAHINALTLLGSIKLMVHGLADEISHQNPKLKVSNAYFIKRLPPNLRLHLSPDSWRLYEVYALLFQSGTTVVLNQDLLMDFPKMNDSSDKGELADCIDTPEPTEPSASDKKPEQEASPVKADALIDSEDSEESNESDNNFSVEDIFSEILSKPTEGEGS